MDPAHKEDDDLELPWWFPDGITVLSEEGSREVLDEIRNGTPLTPERAATFERARRMAGVRKQRMEKGPMSPYHPIISSPEGSREVEEEPANGPLLTTERRAMFERMRQREEVRKTSEALSPDGLVDPYRRTPPLSLEGSRVVEEEMARPPADTPERRALFERVRVRAAMRRRVAEIETGVPDL